MSNKERCKEIFYKHIDLAHKDGRLFRKTVMDEMIAELGISIPSAATNYNTIKKEMDNPIDGLGRSTSGNKKIAKSKQLVVADEDCYSVLELVREGKNYTVGRCQSFQYQGEAGETYEEKCEYYPNSVWVMIQGLGPNSGDNYRLDPEEQELRRYEPN